MPLNGLHFLTIPPSRDVAEHGFPPKVRDWFATHFGVPTLGQRHAWPTILDRNHLLLSAPTGSGKTLAAFLPILCQIANTPRSGLQCLYVAPLKALCRDACVNLRRTWRSMQAAGCHPDVRLRIGLRTGDTSQRVRHRQRTNPPAILLTTPESLAQMLAHQPSFDVLRTLRWVVVDEIHAMLGNKRGADLVLSLERLPADVQRIGLSATCTPLATVAEYLVGDRPCTVAQVADRSEKHLVVEPMCENLDDGPGWLGTLVERLDPELAPDRTTIIFTNTRNLAERLTWALRRRYPERQDAIGVHHSAIAPARRRVVERHLKHGRLWVVVSSTSLELGIDIGSVDRVIFVHPPGGVARLLQRVGRSGHRPEEPRRGLLLTASASELIEAAVTASSGRDGQIETARMIDRPLDVLCQQLIGMAMTGVWRPADAFAMVQRAAPYRGLSLREFEDCLDYLSGRRSDGADWIPARLRWERDRFTIADERTARLLRRNLGTILTEDACIVRLRTASEDDAPAVGEIDLAYADNLQAGDRFMLDGRCLELKERASAEMLVEEVFGRPVAPRWPGLGVPMPAELARRICLFRIEAAEWLRDGEAALGAWLEQEFHLSADAAGALGRHLQLQETVSEVPPLDALLIETVALSACVECYVHTPLPRSANEAIARVLLRRWKRIGINLNLLAVNLGIYLIAHTERPIDVATWRAGFDPDGFADDLQASLEDSDLLRQHFAAAAQTGLMLLRNPAGRKRNVGGKHWAERRLFDHVCEAAPDFVLLRQAERDLLAGPCDLATAHAYVQHLRSLPIRLRHLAEPSPLGWDLTGNGFSFNQQALS
ncbi:MAG TPA: DEAD/DEAH box helicase [Gemmataceae bacterium]|nr:DEAD/DEAH box helicase [Gemmataceae bacterium]